MENPTNYSVFITCRPNDGTGRRSRDYLLAKQLCRRLTDDGVAAYFHQAPDGEPLSSEAAAAVSRAEVLVIAGASAENIASPAVVRDYEAFRASVNAGEKRHFRVATYLLGLERDDLPEVLREFRSFSGLDTEGLMEWIQKQLAWVPPRACVIDEIHMEEEPTVSTPAMAAEPECATDSGLPEWKPAASSAPSPEPAPSRIRARKAPQNSPAQPPYLPLSPSVPTVADEVATRVKPARINKVDFSVVAPSGVKPGGSALVDVFMYTKSQRKIVDKAIKAAKNKVTEAARTGSSVSVRQGSRVTVTLTSDDAALPDASETLVWNGDALDFTFRFSLPEDFGKKQADFGCNVLFDGIHITRLYFSVPVNKAKSVPVKFVRKDSRRAFVSYSSKDRPEVVEQLAAIQTVAPKLRFWMDSQSMTAGDAWRPAIISAINRADIFLLFWSPNAKESNEVRKEWEYALALEQGRTKRLKNGARFISPVPLAPPKECPPPAELNDLHFGDPSFDADIDQIGSVNFDSKKQRPRNITFF